MADFGIPERIRPVTGVQEKKFYILDREWNAHSPGLETLSFHFIDGAE
jgi:hypothetical protein